MTVVRVDKETYESARELHRQRIKDASFGSRDFRVTETEVVVLSYFGITPKLGAPVDISNRAVSVRWAKEWPVAVPSDELDTDVMVFATPIGQDLDIVGWLPINLIEEAPIRWIESKGVRVSYTHEIDRTSLAPLPASFDFVDNCTHLKDWLGIWDWDANAWQCAGCRRHVYDAAGTERAAFHAALDYRVSDQIPSDP